jgi:hypothetical protein
VTKEYHVKIIFISDPATFNGQLSFNHLSSFSLLYQTNCLKAKGRFPTSPESYPKVKCLLSAEIDLHKENAPLRYDTLDVGNGIK